MDNETILDLGERVAVLETRWQADNSDLQEIKSKLDDLLHLKSKGMGALWLVSLIIGSGTLAIVAAFLNFFNRSHL